MRKLLSVRFVRTEKIVDTCMPKVCFVALVALFATACGVDAPSTAPSARPTPGTPAHIELSAVAGTGANGGTARVQARVQDAYAATVPDVAVTFSADAGRLDASTVTTDANGLAVTSLKADAGTVKVHASAGAVEAADAVVTIQPIQSGGATPPPSPIPPTPTGPPDLPFTVAITATLASAGSATQFGLSSPATVATAAWTFGDGGTGSGVAPVHTYSSPNTYTVSVNATDTRGRAASASTAVTIGAPSQSYTVTLAANPTTIDPGTSSNLTATVTPVNGAPAATSFAWDCNGDGTTDQTTTVNTASCTFTASGTASPRVTASNGSVTGTATTTVTVRPVVVTIACTTPIAVNVVDNCNVTVRINNVNVTADVGSVVWSWGDGTANTTVTGSPTTTHTFPQAGVFDVDATVTLIAPHAGATGSATTFKVTVQ